MEVGLGGCDEVDMPTRSTFLACKTCAPATTSTSLQSRRLQTLEAESTVVLSAQALAVLVVEYPKNYPQVPWWRIGDGNGSACRQCHSKGEGDRSHHIYPFDAEFCTQVRNLHKEYVEGKSETRDVLIVAHGHFNRVLICRWLTFPLVLGEHNHRVVRNPHPDDLE